MSQRPLRGAKSFQITRRPQTPTPGPSPSHLAPVPAPSDSPWCEQCGVIVGNWPLHRKFHVELAKTSRWVQAATEFMQLLGRDHPELGSFPTTDDTPTDGDNTTTDGK